MPVLRHGAQCRAAAGSHRQGQPGPGLLAQVVTAKVLDHLSLQRQQKIYAREGVQLPESTLTDWFGPTAAVLSPLAAA